MPLSADEAELVAVEVVVCPTEQVAATHKASVSTAMLKLKLNLSRGSKAKLTFRQKIAHRAPVPLQHWIRALVKHS